MDLLKLRIWLKVILFSLLALYTLLFLLFNSGPITLWLFFGTQFNTNLVIALLGAFLLGAMLTLLVRTILTTVRQIRSSRERDRTARLEREISEMRTKAATLKTRDE